ncbi:MAG: hypothetical protein JO353_02415 [Phycisphaerae bacterium]|nr:hypothetical protein [Phycisphaerae bacterium]
MIGTSLDDNLVQQSAMTLLELLGGTAVLLSVYHLLLWAVRSYRRRHAQHDHRHPPTIRSA